MAKISSQLAAYLAKNKYHYDIIEHRKTYTAWDTAQTEKVKPQTVAKALVIRTDDSYFVALVPAHRKIDKKKLLEVVNKARKKQGLKLNKKVELAEESWMKKNIPGKLGAIAPFRAVLKCDIFMDRLLAKNRKAYFGSGEYTLSLLIPLKQYLKIEKPIIGSFSAAKK